MSLIMRRTKIVTTLGPASESPEMITQMIAAGINVARLNFSHGEPEEHMKRVQLVRDAAEEQGRVVGILADLQGPKIRISRFKNGKVVLQDGAPFILDAALDKDAGDETRVGIDYKELPQDVKPDDLLLLADGRLELVVSKVQGAQIFCHVKVGGELSNNKGINRQGGGLTAPALTDKDKKDLKTAVAMQVDYIAISFPRSAEDMLLARRLVQEAGGNAGLIAKIERVEAVEPKTLDEIINACDGIMVARGDLGVEIGEAEVPAAQKYMIERARALNKPVITATQMMETMIHSVTPTRAEVSDVANAVLDGTDAVMLSEETAKGDHPALVVKTMHKICLAAEKNPRALFVPDKVEPLFNRVDEAISSSTMYAANHLKNIKAIVSLTESGSTPLWMSRVRSGIPIYGLSRHLNTLGKMALYSDVYPIYFDVSKYTSSTQVKREAIAELQRRSLVDNGDLVIITKGSHEGVHGGTNSLTIAKVGEAV